MPGRNCGMLTLFPTMPYRSLRFPLLSLALTLGLCACSPAPKAGSASPAPTAATPAVTSVAAVPAASSDADLAAGKAVYLRICIACHMPEGQGVPGVFPPLKGSHYLADEDPAKLIRIVLHGLQGPVEVNGVTYNSIMPPQGPLLKDREIARVLTYVRQIWGDGAPPVTEAAVADVRQSTTRATPWTIAELDRLVP
jgi:mono/diheme cytochrome c family protein